MDWLVAARWTTRCTRFRFHKLNRSHIPGMKQEDYLLLLATVGTGTGIHVVRRAVVEDFA